MSRFELAAFEPIDPADMEDQLRERSESISLARDDAFERGYEAFDPVGNMDAAARTYYSHPRLLTDFCDGWQTAALEAQS